MSTTLATLGLVLTASAAPEAHTVRPPARVSIEGLAGDWDAGASSLTVTDAEVHGGPRAVRRALRARDGIELDIGPRTRIVTEDADGVRERIDADTLFADLDASADDLDVEASATIARDASPSDALTITARRVVLYLPAPDDATDPGDGSDPADPADDSSADPAGATPPSAPPAPEAEGGARRGRGR